MLSASYRSCPAASHSVPPSSPTHIASPLPSGTDMVADLSQRDGSATPRLTDDEDDGEGAGNGHGSIGESLDIWQHPNTGDLMHSPLWLLLCAAV